MPYVEDLAMQIGSQAAGGLFGMVLGDINDKRQLRQQEKLQNLQIQGNKQMGDYNYAKQLQMWKDTSYEAQVEQMRKAGVNPALLYGMSGGGGQTTGSAGPGVEAGKAPVGGREIQDSMGMAMQLQLLKAQKENIEADTANKRGEAANKPLQGENIKADTELKNVGVRIQEIEEYVKGKSQNMAISMLSTALQEETEKLEILKNEHKISTATVDDKIKEIQARAVGAALQNALSKSQKKLTDKETWAIGMRVVNEAWAMGQAAYINTQNADANTKNANTNRAKLTNDIMNETGLPEQIVGNIVDILILKNLMAPTQGHSPIKGFRQ